MKAKLIQLLLIQIPNIQDAYHFDFDKLNTDKCKDLSEAIIKCVNYDPTSLEIANKDFNGCELYKSSPGMILGLTRMVCAKDENGKLCPISEGQQKTIPEDVNEIMINDTCKSKVCTEQAILAFKGKQKNGTSKYDGFIATLSDEKCSGNKTIESNTIENKNNENKVNESSGATHIKVGSLVNEKFKQ
ncbi:hypothetical protein PIROE2DRAFT_18003 [Piromyces sp. E2]|nr:hypothetical protein PIROE2DRAFT_18003 [Piromyces sp. E2]|eukprot:OUM57110.1 hypothetical protein PIROE2DRAFT_18003 [Piromyces sp. E2]